MTQHRERARAPGSALAGDAAAGGGLARGAVAVDAQRETAAGEPDKEWTQASRRGGLESGGGAAALARAAGAGASCCARHPRDELVGERLADEEDYGECAASSDEHDTLVDRPVQPSLEWISWMGAIEHVAMDHGAAAAARKAASILNVQYPKKLRAKLRGAGLGHVCSGTLQRADGEVLTCVEGLGELASEAVNDCHGQLLYFLYEMMGTGIGMGLGDEFSEDEERAFVRERANALMAASVLPDHCSRWAAVLGVVGPLVSGGSRDSA